MKKLLLFAFALMLTPAIKAQTAQIKYQGEVLAGYSIGIGDFGVDRINIHTIHGVKIGKYFSLGLGFGLDYYHTFNRYLNTSIVASELSMPIFLAPKGYLPVSDKTQLFLGVNVGLSLGLTEGIKGDSGFLITPEVGASFNVSDKNAITVSLAYNHQAWPYRFLIINDDAISIKLGFKF